MVGLLALFLAAQTFQPPKNNGILQGPADLAVAVRVPADVLSILKRSCYDCHSNHTTYPWYNHITPINWWIAGHINNGKEDVNFTLFKEYPKAVQAEILEAIVHSIKTDEMPLKSYLITHTNAELSAEEKRLVTTWARQQWMR